MNNNDTILENALKTLKVDLTNIDFWADAHIKACKVIYEQNYFTILGEYYKAYKAQGFIPCELTFRMWYKLNYEQDADK